MNIVQRLFSNTLLSFIASMMAKGSDVLLFIGIGRLLGPDVVGDFVLGKTYYIIALTLSAWGLHEILVREITRHRKESGRYFVNYLVIRIILAIAAYSILLIILDLWLPYSAQSETIIRIIALTIFPEAIISLGQALFVAHENMKIPALAAFTNGAVKLGAGWWLLKGGFSIYTIAWVIPVGSSISLLIYFPAILRLLQQTPQYIPIRLNLSFSLKQLRYTPGFIVMGFFYILDLQADTLLISLYLGTAEIGWYGAAQSIMLGFWMLASAVRTALYPLMTRYQYTETSKFEELYRKATKYLLIFILPIAAGITILAEPIIVYIYKDAFIPAAPVLQWSIWAVVFAFLNVPTIILILIFNLQKHLTWMTGISMSLNIGLNLWLLPVYGIVGSAIARTIATFTLFLLSYLYVEHHVIKVNLLSLALRPIVATLFMSTIIWQLYDDVLLIWLVLIGIVAYVLSIIALGAISAEDRQYLRQLIRI